MGAKDSVRPIPMKSSCILYGNAWLCFRVNKIQNKKAVYKWLERYSCLTRLGMKYNPRLLINITKGPSGPEALT